MINTLTNTLSIILLCVFFALFFVRVILLKKRGIQAIVFAKTHPSDYFLMPIMFLLVYTAFASSLSWLPFPRVLLKPLFENNTFSWIGILLSAAGLIGFVWTLVSFGDSFRVGIDTEKPDKLITNGTFSISRNPIYVAFIIFFFGLTLVHTNIASIIMLFCFFIPIIHRQIIREEDFLKAHYGDTYIAYSKKVRRYL